MRVRTSLISFLITFMCFGCAPGRIGTAPVDGGERFSLHAPDAASVAIAGSFNEWDPHKNKLSGPDKNGDWSITLPLAPGRYEYLFVMNGKDWLPDPAAAPVDDGLGGKNSVVFVPVKTL